MWFATGKGHKGISSEKHRIIADGTNDRDGRGISSLDSIALIFVRLS
jgi:hypothetical protein